MSEITHEYTRGETGESIVVRNGRLEMTWEEDAQLVLKDPLDRFTSVAGGPLIELGPAASLSRRSRAHGLGLSHTGRPQPFPIADAHGPGIELRRSFPIAVQPLIAEWSLRLYERHDFVRTQITLRNVSSEPMVIHRVFPFVTGSWWGNGALRLNNRQQRFAVYKDGWQSWSYAGGLGTDMSDPRPNSKRLVAWHSPGGATPRQPFGESVDVVSEAVAMLGQSGESLALLAGFLSCDEWLGQLYAQREEGSFAAAALCDDHTLAPGATLTTPPLLLALGTAEHLLPRYAEAVAREQQARPAPRAYSGWSSWYYYYTGVTEADVRENLRTLQSLRPLITPALVQIDDGYQEAVGDWLSLNEKFPGGMPSLTRDIRAAGYEPGIWLAPFTVAANSRLAREHPQWLVHDPKGALAYAGSNWGNDLYALDTSHPDAREWLRVLFTTIVHEWGYRYLKLDFLASAALPGLRHDPTMTRARALREGLTLIREIVGEEVFILGCGCPLLSAVGLVDAMRIGPDSAPYWSPRYNGATASFSETHPEPAMEGALRNTLTRAWMSPALWTNDPDCLILRDQLSELTRDEVRAFASAVGLTGGMTLLSDRLAQLPVERLEIVAQLIPPMPERALPSDPFAAGTPQRIAVRVMRPWGAWLLVGLFNSEAHARDISLRWRDLGLENGAYHAVEFWTGAYLGLSEDGVSVRVGAHGAAVLAIRAASDRPLLLSTNLHISQGAVEIANWEYDHERNSIHWKAQPGRHVLATFTLWLPAALAPARLSSDARGATWRWYAKEQRIVSVTAEIDNEATFTLELESDSE